MNRTRDIEFGRCLFKYAPEEGVLYLHSTDIHGESHMHRFHLHDAFLVNIGGNYWRFVTGVSDGSEARYLFEDVSQAADAHVEALRRIGVTILDKVAGKQNLERHKLPIKRLLLTS